MYFLIENIHSLINTYFLTKGMVFSTETFFGATEERKLFFTILIDTKKDGLIFGDTFSI